MVTDKDILAFFRAEISLLATFAFKSIPLELDTPLQDYAEDDELAWAIEKYGKTYGVDVADLNWDKYYPWKTEWFFRKWLTKHPLRQEKPPLTVRMFAESAKVGRWLY